MSEGMTYRAPAASNYGDKIGYIVYRSGTDEVTVSTDPTQAAQHPHGVITAAENVAGGIVSVAIAGMRCFVRCGAAVTIGTHNVLMADGDGEAVAATDGNWAVGYFAGKVSGADNDLVEMVVSPHFYNT